MMIRCESDALPRALLAVTVIHCAPVRPAVQLKTCVSLMAALICTTDSWCVASQENVIGSEVASGVTAAVKA